MRVMSLSAKFSVAAVILASLVWGRAAAAPDTISLQANWALASAREAGASGEILSRPGYDARNWHPARHVPATVLEILQEDGVYPDLYVGKNLVTKVPRDLYKQDWWYRTRFDAPEGGQAYWLDFDGINYRAEIWLNGKRIAGDRQVVGMYAATRLNVSDAIRKGGPNILAVKVTPERAIQDINGVELADSWFDWLNGKYIGYGAATSRNGIPVSYVSDRNAGIWKPVTLRVTGPVRMSHLAVVTMLPLPRTDSAKLTVYAEVENGTSRQIRGILLGKISRPGKAAIRFEQPVTLDAGERREVRFTPARFRQLMVAHPDLWWPYTLGKPDLYDLQLEFRAGQGVLSDRQTIRFGIRTVTQHRDRDEQFADIGKGGNFYLKVNGKDFLIRGAVYTPDLLYRDDPAREDAVIRYVKDLGLNMLRWESKISSERIVRLADEAGIPLMFGWMCCNQWEKWDQWDAEDRRVAMTSLRSQISMLRAHPAVFLWANGSDGLPPPAVLKGYRQILADLHWQNATVDTVSSFAEDGMGNKLWSGIHMEGPYSWRPPGYWFAGRYPPARGASAEQGDNEIIPPYESLKKFIPPDKLWPINDTWFFHAGATKGNNVLANIQRVIDKRYGPARSAEDFAAKAQLAHYENARAQFEDFAANGWADHKMTLYWMLNSHWPSFFGHLFDYYLKPGGAYFGAKMGLRPVSIVFDSYARDPERGHVRVVNQTLTPRRRLRARVRIYDLDGKTMFDRRVEMDAGAQGVAEAMILPRIKAITPVYFVRCELFDAKGRIAENVYWQSTTPDDVGPRDNDTAFVAKQKSWADFTALQSMAKVALEGKAALRKTAAGNDAVILLRNPTGRIAFFVRAEITDGQDGEEILPITYDNNYVTVFPGETVTLHGHFGNAGPSRGQAWLRLEGVNAPKELIAIR